MRPSVFAVLRLITSSKRVELRERAGGGHELVVDVPEARVFGIRFGRGPGSHEAAELAQAALELAVRYGRP